MMFGFEAGLGFFVALALCSLAVACIREIAVALVVAAAGGGLWLLAAACQDPVFAERATPTILILLALPLIPQLIGLFDDGAWGRRALRRLFKKPPPPARTATLVRPRRD
jgi:hypothetical protein